MAPVATLVTPASQRTLDGVFYATMYRNVCKFKYKHGNVPETRAIGLHYTDIKIRRNASANRISTSHTVRLVHLGLLDAVDHCNVRELLQLRTERVSV